MSQIQGQALHITNTFISKEHTGKSIEKPTVIWAEAYSYNSVAVLNRQQSNKGFSHSVFTTNNETVIFHATFKPNTNTTTQIMFGKCCNAAPGSTCTQD